MEDLEARLLQDEEWFDETRDLFAATQSELLHEVTHLCGGTLPHSNVEEEYLDEPMGLYRRNRV